MADLWCKRVVRFVSRRLTHLALAVLLVCGLSLAACRLLDEDVVKLAKALIARADADDSIPSLGAGFDAQYGSGSSNSTWLVIQLTFTKNCTETPDDPCEALANELAGIVFDQYAAVDTLHGLQIIIINDAVGESFAPGTTNSVANQTAGSTFERSADHLVKSLTIREWRKELFAEGNT